MASIPAIGLGINTADVYLKPKDARPYAKHFDSFCPDIHIGLKDFYINGFTQRRLIQFLKVSTGIMYCEIPMKSEIPYWCSGLVKHGRKVET